MAFPAPALTLPGQLNSQVSSSAAPKFLPSYGLSNRSLGRNKCKRRKNIKVRVSMAPEADAGEAPPSSQVIFGGEKQLSGPEKVFESLSAPARYGVCAVIVAGALAAGYAVGATTKGTRTAAFGGALALGVAGGATAYALNSTAPRIAAAALHNKVVKCDDPTSLNREEIDSLLHKYGVSKQDEAFNAELCNLYERYVSSIIPSGNEDLKGDEAESIIKFKKALGIDDPDAAAVHIEIGRRIFRQRLETGDRDAVIAERRAFQKLVYVSNLVFGDASTFLLPWKRVFKVTNAQVEVAVRDNAQRLFQSRLSSLGKDVDEKNLMDLREAQLKLKLPDEIAADMFRDYTRKHIEEYISSALEVMKSQGRVRGSALKVTEELNKLLAYNQALTDLKNNGDKERLPPGIGSVSVLGGEYDSDRKIDELRQLYRAYATEAFSSGCLEDDKVSALNQLKNIFSLGNRETEQIMLEITTKVYRRRLSQVVSGGDLEAAPSKAVFLQNLCDELRFDPKKASEVHEDIYRQKLQQCVADGNLSKEDVAALLRLRVLLCIPQQTVDTAHADICGRLFQKVVDEAISAGVVGYDSEMKAKVHKAAQGLRLTKEAAMAITSKAVRSVFVTYVKRARTAESRTESARELKKMIIFNNLVVTKLLADIKGESPVVSPEPAKEEPKQDEEDKWESLQTWRKTKPSKELEDKFGAEAQSEITLKDDLSLRDRTDLYRTYLLYCISGETTGLPFGTQIVTKKDNKEYLRLGQLGGILGLTSKEVADVHISLAEQAFRQQAQVILADGQLSKARIEQLNELQKQVGLPSESAQKVIKSITTTRISGAIEAAVSQGKMTIAQIRELREANVDLDNMIAKEVRENLFKKTIDEIFSSGTGDFNEEEVYERIPADLGIDVGKAKRIVQDLAKERLSNSLVQAVALLRQRNLSGVVSSLNNLLACDKAVPAEPLSWSVPEEVSDLFSLYLKDNPSEEKVARLQYLLGINDSTALSLKQSVTAGAFTLGVEEEEFIF